MTGNGLVSMQPSAFTEVSKPPYVVVSQHPLDCTGLNQLTNIKGRSLIRCIDSEMRVQPNTVVYGLERLGGRL
jgi:hypothetical protein